MILHVDMDAYYASVEERDDPRLVGKAVIVGGTPAGRGVVAAANYIARRFGVHSAMSSVTAQRLCPQAIVIRPRMQHYAEVSQQIRAIFERYSPLVEPLSLDEAFLDVTGSEPLFGTADIIGRRIKEDIRREVRLVASVGVAPNKFLAKIASDLRKPDGFVVVEPTAVQEFLDPLPVSRLWGVGRVTGATFQRIGIETIEQLKNLSTATLEKLCGQATASKLWHLARGIDHRTVTPDREAKTISHETTFAANIAEPEALRGWLLELTEQVARRLRRHDLSGRTVHLKIRSSDFHTLTRAHTLARPTHVTQELWEAAAGLLTPRLLEQVMPVRLLGIGVSGLAQDAKTQQQLFDGDEHRKLGQLDAVADAIQQRFGTSALKRGTNLHGRDR